MHILVLPSWYPTKEDPVLGSFFAEQARALAEFGHQVSVFAVYSDAEKGVSTEKTVLGQLTEYKIHVKPLRFHLTYFCVVGEMLRILRREFGGKQPEIVHVHSFRAIRYAKAIRRLLGIPFVVTEHVTWFERKMLSEKELRSISRDYHAAEEVIAVGEGLREQIAPLCGKEPIVIPNMVDDRFLTGGLHVPQNGDFGFVSVALLDRKKGVDVLLHAFAKLCETEKQVHLTICGDGEEGESLRALSQSLGLTERVTFKGMVSREECARILRENQAFVLPSRIETFGVVYAEAMACGLPVIMTKTSAWKVLVREETGLAVEIDDVNGLALAMEQMLLQYDRYDPETIHVFCQDSFSRDSVCRRLTELYGKILKKTAERR